MFAVLDTNHFRELTENSRAGQRLQEKISAICLVHDAVLLTRNLGDFERVPALKLENWLD